MENVEKDAAKRDAARSKARILDAAEALFARRGFAAVALGAIAAEAGVSKGLPLYFFGSKEGLWDAVVSRLFARGAAVVEGAAGRDPREALDAGVDAYIDFLAANPDFLRLMTRMALDPRPGEPRGEALLAGALGSLDGVPGDRAQLLISVMALCAFPLSQADNLLAALGLDAADPAFLAARKAHVKALLRHGAFGPA